MFKSNNNNNQELLLVREQQLQPLITKPGDGVIVYHDIVDTTVDTITNNDSGYNNNKNKNDKNKKQDADEISRASTRADSEISESMYILEKDRPTVYINIYIIDPRKAVENEVEKNLDEASQTTYVPGFIKSLAQVAAPKLLWDWAPPQVMASQLSAQLLTQVPEKMREKGLHVAMEEAFRAGPYVVLRLQVKYVDTLVLAATSGDDDDDDDNDDSSTDSDNEGCLFFCCKPIIQSFYGLVGHKQQKAIEGNYLPNLVHTRLAQTMDELLAENLEKEKFKAESKVLSENEQAKYFFEKLHEIREYMPNDTVSAMAHTTGCISRSNVNENANKTDSENNSITDKEIC